MGASCCSFEKSQVRWNNGPGDAIKVSLPVPATAATPPESVEGRAQAVAATESVACQPQGAAKTNKAIEKLRNSVLGTVRELQAFRKFLKPLYEKPADAFQEFAAGEDHISRAMFVNRLLGLGFDGNADKVFDALCDGDGLITAHNFKQCLVAARKPQRFADVVEQAVLAKKRGRSPQSSQQDEPGVAGRSLRRSKRMPLH